MTELQQTQYDRFILAGYPPDMATQLVERGAWLGVHEPFEEDVAEIRRYRAERDSRADGRAADAGPNP